MVENRFDQTICAQASASGPGAVSIIRISGPDTYGILDSVFKTVKGEGISSIPGYRMVYGAISDPLSQEVIDEVLVAVFRAPHSYTGENSAEIYCHGSDYIVSAILKLLIRNGARMAAPGEFTQRAFLNGKMDLTQAEAVADLISSESKAAHDVALQQLKGGFSSELKLMRSELVDIVALMELELDFSEEDVEFADRSRLRELVDAVQEHIRTLTDSFAFGNAIKNGVPVAIVGAVNTGKSTLLNAILGEERAIVSDIAGTTRDTIEDSIIIDGIHFRFIDTAGIRDTDETIEQIGISRSRQKMKEASVILLLLDATRPEEFSKSINDTISHLAGTPGKKRIFILINKSDMSGDITSLLTSAENILQNSLRNNTPDTENYCQKDCVRDTWEREAGRNHNDTESQEVVGNHWNIMAISAKQRSGLSHLTESIAAGWKSAKTASATTVTNLRHYEALSSAQSALTRVRSGLDSSLSTELLSEDIRLALHHIGTITGEISPDEILGTIFGRFCIGK